VKKTFVLIITFLLLGSALPANAGNRSQATKTVTASAANWLITSNLTLSSNSYQMTRNLFQANGNEPESLFFTLTNSGSLPVNGFSLRVRQSASPVALTLQGCASPWTLGVGANKGKDSCSNTSLTFSTVVATGTDSTFLINLSPAFSSNTTLFMRASVPKNTNKDYQLDIAVARSNVRLGAVSNS